MTGVQTCALPIYTLMSSTPDVGRDDDSTKPLVLWLVPLIGVTLVPGLWWMRADQPFAVRADLLATMAVLVGAFAVTVVALLSRGFRRRVRWSLGVSTMAVIVTFLWVLFAAIGNMFVSASGFRIVGDVVPVVLAGTLLWLASRLGQDWEFATLLGVVVVAVLGILVVANLALVAPSASDAGNPRAVPGAPDVLLLILDEYGRDDWFRAEFDFDNSPFLADLEERGFMIATQATANYSYSYGSVSSILGLDYSFTEGDITDSELTQMRATLTGSVGILPAFKNAGYEIAYFENAWSGSLCGTIVDWCIRDGITERGLWNLGQMTILAPLLSEVRGGPLNSVSLRHLRSLGAVLTAPRDSGKPRFTFAHLLLPHFPLLLDEACNANPPDDLRTWGGGGGAVLAERRANYIAQLKCVNTGVISAIDAFLGENPDGIIMIVGDHGPASTFNWELPFAEHSIDTVTERMTVLSAYRFPECSRAVKPDMTPVNGARTLVSCALGTELPELPDLNYWMDEIGSGSVIDITSFLND